MTRDHYIEEVNLSIAWGKALRVAASRGFKEIVPLIVSVTGFDTTNDVVEDANIREALDHELEHNKHYSINTIANTIFPTSLWNSNQSRNSLYRRYSKIVPKLTKANGQNRHGLYFERMTTGGPSGKENQLEFILDTYHKGFRRGVLQIAVFDPHRDHVASARRGFPCLQHLTFAPHGDTLSVNAFYATQYLVGRAYGNYLGLCRLGKFVAHELGLNLVRMTCFTGIAECDSPKNRLAPLFEVIDAATGTHNQE